jgi:hypothetical protein
MNKPNQPTYHSPDFRSYPVEYVKKNGRSGTLKNDRGESIGLQRCEHLVDGRWRAFYKMVKATP